MKINSNEKVFSHFVKIHFMNKLQIGIPIGLGIIISVIILIILFSPNQEITGVKNLDNKEISSDENILPEIQEKLDEIERKKLENQYIPRDREWITSGPFQLDRSEYWLGEKIFLRIGEMSLNEKGYVEFMHPLNETHLTTYLKIPFDGESNKGFNYYMNPKLSKNKGVCSVDQILGEWIVIFRGTQYANLSFEVINKTIPGEEEEFNNPIC